MGDFLGDAHLFGEAALLSAEAARPFVEVVLLFAEAARPFVEVALLYAEVARPFVEVVLLYVKAALPCVEIAHLLETEHVEYPDLLAALLGTVDHLVIVVIVLLEDVALALIAAFHEALPGEEGDAVLVTPVHALILQHDLLPFLAHLASRKSGESKVTFLP